MDVPRRASPEWDVPLTAATRGAIAYALTPKSRNAALSVVLRSVDSLR